MKIETKYNLGQEVWISLCEKHTLCVIEGVVYYKLINLNCIYYKLVIKNKSDCSFIKEENELFPTKEELLKSL